jgi:hypothetical protein
VRLNNTTTNLRVGLKEIALFIPLLLALCLISNPVFTAYAQYYPPAGTYPGTFPGTFPQTPGFIPGQTAYPYLPPAQTTFPASVFPPTQSFLPSTSFAVPTGSLSPWFPSIPAVSCGGTFTLTIVGDVHNNNNNNNNNKNDNNNNNNKNDNNNNNGHSDSKKTIALQIQAAGGTDLNQNTISGQIFKGKDNIKHNDGQDFTVRGVSNDCQVPMFSK